MELSSPAFSDNDFIPYENSAYGENLSPPLNFKNVPVEAQCLAVVMEDPDAPKPTPFQHWLVWNIPITVSKFNEGEVPAECREGMNDSHSLGYFGPRPPSGTHHYIFTLYALNKQLDIKEGSLRQELDDAMLGNIIDTTKLTGLYQP